MNTNQVSRIRVENKNKRPGYNGQSMACYFGDMNAFYATLELESLKAENKVGGITDHRIGTSRMGAFPHSIRSIYMRCGFIVALLPLLPAR